MVCVFVQFELCCLVCVCVSFAGHMFCLKCDVCTVCVVWVLCVCFVCLLCLRLRCMYVWSWLLARFGCIPGKWYPTKLAKKGQNLLCLTHLFSPFYECKQSNILFSCLANLLSRKFAIFFVSFCLPIFVGVSVACMRYVYGLIHIYTINCVIFCLWFVFWKVFERFEMAMWLHSTYDG